VIEQIIDYHLAHEGISRVVKILHCHRQFLGIDLDPSQHQKLCHKYTTLVEDKVIACREINGASLFLQSYHKDSHFFVVSGTPEDELRRIVTQRGLADYFEAVYGSPRTKDVIVREILDELELPRHQCLFVGDAMTDYHAAMATDIPFIGRVNKCEVGPFPEGTPMVGDLKALAEYLLCA